MAGDEPDTALPRFWDVAGRKPKHDSSRSRTMPLGRRAIAIAAMLHVICGCVVRA